MGGVTIRSLQTLQVDWVHDPLYRVTERSYENVDHRRSCWVCGGPFEVGQEIAVLGTDASNEVAHSQCYRAQCAEVT